MSFGYIGDTSTSIKQQVKNTGVLSMSDVLDLKSKGHLGGSLEHINTETVSSSVDSINLINLADTPYDVYLVHFIDIVASSTQQMYFRVSNDNGSSYEAGSSAYEYCGFRYHSSSAANDPRSTGDNAIATDLYTDATGSFNAYVYLYNFLDSSKFSSLNYHGVSSLSGTMRMGYGGGVYQTAEVTNGFQLLSSGTTGGTAKLYGLKQL